MHDVTPQAHTATKRAARLAPCVGQGRTMRARGGARPRAATAWTDTRRRSPVKCSVCCALPAHLRQIPQRYVCVYVCRLVCEFLHHRVCGMFTRQSCPPHACICTLATQSPHILAFTHLHAYHIRFWCLIRMFLSHGKQRYVFPCYDQCVHFHTCMTMRSYAHVYEVQPHVSV
jgi:hypothetical protein